MALQESTYCLQGIRKQTGKMLWDPINILPTEIEFDCSNISEPVVAPTTSRITNSLKAV